jgi:flagellar hook protein FlgE
MAVNPIMQAGVSGVQAGLRGLNRTAQDIAELNVDEGSAKVGAGDDGVVRPDRPADKLADASDALVELKLHKRQVQASARVIETADEVLGFLLDVRA